MLNLVFPRPLRHVLKELTGINRHVKSLVGTAEARHAVEVAALRQKIKEMSRPEGYNQELAARHYQALDVYAKLTAEIGRQDLDVPTLSQLRSQTASFAQCHEVLFMEWCERIRHKPIIHRKLWEWVFILEALASRGMITPGKKGLGFGVGRERIVPYLASQGCSLLATDLGITDEESLVWSASGQHASDLSYLNVEGLCDPRLFEQRVTFQPADMNHFDLPEQAFDFLWSSCAFEHLGTLEKGLAFVKKSLRCLKPGGMAVHTTELNLTSDTETVAAGGTVLYRKQDLIQLKEELDASGYSMAPLCFHAGTHTLDYELLFEWEDVYSTPRNLKCVLGGFVTTSIGIIIRKK